MSDIEHHFHVIGIDEGDDSATVLAEFTNSGSARNWMKDYVAKENAGGWNIIEVIDTRGTEDGEGCAETVYRWERD